jgi:hypothetical protein
MTGAPAPTSQAPGPRSVFIDVYGFRAEIRGAPAEAVENLGSDFAHFRCLSGDSAAVVELVEQEPPYDEVPPLRATVYTPRNVSFRHGDLTYVDYAGRALAIHDRRAGTLRIFSLNPDLLYEAAYLFLLSRMAEFLDARRLHRIHALGVSLADRAVLVILPMGGGKSTLASELLKYPEVKLLSDDSPLVDSAATLHAFPLRIGLLPGNEAEIPPQHLRRIHRMEFGPKILVSYAYFADRVCRQAPPGVLFLGRRSLARTCEIRPASSGAAIKAMLTNCVVGLGLFQGLEFVLHASPAELAGKLGVGFSRLRHSLRLVRRSKCFHLVLGRDTRRNGAAIMEFLRREFPAAGA